eukprot:scaffold2.g7129.t1
MSKGALQPALARFWGSYLRGRRREANRGGLKVPEDYDNLLKAAGECASLTKANATSAPLKQLLHARRDLQNAIEAAERDLETARQHLLLKHAQELVPEEPLPAATPPAGPQPSTVVSLPLPPDDVLFEAGNMERELLAKQAAFQSAKDEGAHLAREAELADATLAGHLAHKPDLTDCRAPTPLSAPRLPPQGCGRKFCTVEERRQHLTDHHKRKKGQIRPLPQYRKAANGGRKGTDAAASAAASAAGAAADAAQQAAPGQAGAAGGVGTSAAEGGGRRGGEGEPMEEDPLVAAAAQGLSRLTTAAEQSSVPQVVSFGRGRGRGLPGVGRGRGGQKARSGMVD